MLIVAHRGGNPGDVENSAPAFAHGISAGADLLECDLQLSASGDIVIHHDTNHFGAPINGFTTDELRGLIPTLMTLDEFLAFVEGIRPDIRLVLDLKSRQVDRALVPFLERETFRHTVLVTSTFSFGLRRLHRRFPALRTGLSRGALFTRIPARLRPLGAATIGRLTILLALVQMSVMGIETAALQHRLVGRKTIETFHGRGMRLYVWTVDSNSEAKRLQELGADYLATNDPARIKRFVDIR